MFNILTVWLVTAAVALLYSLLNSVCDNIYNTDSRE